MKTSKIFNLGGINLRGTGKRYPVSVQIELKKRGGNEIVRYDPETKTYAGTGEFTPEYVEFTACADAGAALGGQCLDEINEHRRDFRPFARFIWDQVYMFWKKYHLNGMHAGTPEQEEAVKAYRSQSGHYRADYTEVCNHLKDIGLYEVMYTGKSTGKMYDNEPYQYGHGWLVQDIPEDDIHAIQNLIDMEEE